MTWGRRHEAGARLYTYNTLLALPLMASAGLHLYKKGESKNKKKMIKRLKDGKKFCETFIDIDFVSIEDMSEKFRSDGDAKRLIVYFELPKIFSEKERNELRIDVLNIKNTLEAALNGEKIKEEHLEEAQRVLDKIYSVINERTSYDKYAAGRIFTGSPFVGRGVC